MYILDQEASCERERRHPYVKSHRFADHILSQPMKSLFVGNGSPAMISAQDLHGHYEFRIFIRADEPCCGKETKYLARASAHGDILSPT